jgi:hypothetical protein
MINLHMSEGLSGGQDLRGIPETHCIGSKRKGHIQKQEKTDNFRFFLMTVFLGY